MIKHRPEAVDISRGGYGARVGRLLRRHVVRRAEDGDRLREIAFALHPFRETEIAYVRFVRGVEENVRRFQVAMEDAVLMCVSHGARQLRNQGRGLAWLLPVTLDPRRESPAFREL